MAGYKVDDLEKVGIAGLTALVRIKQQETTTASAPSTPLEDGSLANDHIILNPVQINIEGRVTDIILRPQAESVAFRRGIAEIGNITKYAPTRTQTQANKVLGMIVDIDGYRAKLKALSENSQQAFDYFTGGNDTTVSNINQFLDKLEKLHLSKTPMVIETPTKVYKNMVIVSRVISRDNTTDKAIDFKITAQQLRFAKVIYTDSRKYFKAPATGSVSDKTKDKVNNGLNDLPEVETSFATSTKNAISGLL